MKDIDNTRLAMRVAKVTIIQNIILSAFKFAAGIIGHSQAMLSDAIHSASDVFSTVIVMIGVHISAKESDDEHQYGHERFECVAAIILAVMLAATGVGIGYSGIKQIITGNYSNKTLPGIIALFAAVVSIIVKEAMFHYTKKTAKTTKSDALMADAWHHRSDALSSVGSFIGIGGCIIGVTVMDAAASVVISIFIIKAAYDIFKDTINKMVDKACDTDTRDNIMMCALEVDGVTDIDSLRTRVFGTRMYVDIEICADGSLSLMEAHTIAENVHDAVEKTFPLVKHCMVSVNPVIIEEYD